jgi:hypothetical protein
MISHLNLTIPVSEIDDLNAGGAGMPVPASVFKDNAR